MICFCFFCFFHGHLSYPQQISLRLHQVCCMQSWEPPLCCLLHPCPCGCVCQQAFSTLVSLLTFFILCFHLVLAHCTVPPSEAFLMSRVLQDSFSHLDYHFLCLHIQSDQVQIIKSPHTVQSRSKMQHCPQWKHCGLERGCFCGLSLPTPPIQIAPVA